MWVLGLNPERKKDISGKSGETQVPYFILYIFPLVLINVL